MPEKEEAIRQKLANVVRDLHSNGTKDPEAMALLGSLADAVMARHKAQRWLEVKTAMSEDEVKETLGTFDRRGDAFYREGRIKQAYAIQALATSVLVHSQWDPELREGERLLDEVIDRAVAFYRKQPKPKPQSKKT